MTSPRIQTAIKAMLALNAALSDISHWPLEAASLRYQMSDQATRLISQLNDNDLPRGVEPRCESTGCYRTWVEEGKVPVAELLEEGAQAEENETVREDTCVKPPVSLDKNAQPAAAEQAVEIPQASSRAGEIVSATASSPLQRSSNSPPPPSPQIKEGHPSPNPSSARSLPAGETLLYQLSASKSPADHPTNEASISTTPRDPRKRPSSSSPPSPSPQIKKERTRPNESPATEPPVPVPSPSNQLASLFADRAARLEAHQSARRLEEREEARAKTRARQEAVAKDPAKAEQRKHAEAMKAKLAKEKEAKEMVKRRIESDRREREARIEMERMNRAGRTVVVEGMAKVRGEKKVEVVRKTRHQMDVERERGGVAELDDDVDDEDYERHEDDDGDDDDDEMERLW